MSIKASNLFETDIINAEAVMNTLPFLLANSDTRVQRKGERRQTTKHIYVVTYSINTSIADGLIGKQRLPLILCNLVEACVQRKLMRIPCSVQLAHLFHRCKTALLSGMHLDSTFCAAVFKDREITSKVLEPGKDASMQYCCRTS